MKKILKNILNGLKFFPVGVMLLIISYVLVYFIDGEKTYLIELSKLTSVDVLVYEICMSGIWFSCLGVTVGFVLTDIESGKYKASVKLKDFIKYILALFLFVICGVLVEYNNKFPSGFDGEVGIVYMGFLIVSMLVLAIIYVIYKAIEEVKLKKGLDRKKSELK